MNFFGHAAVASWHSRRPAFVLGTMLPDFAAMIRSRPPVVADPVVARGIAFHHATDRVFHDSRVFRELSGQAFEDLTRLGLPRGPARAVAHVGVEILIDGALASDPVARRAYLAALTLGRALGSDQLSWDRRSQRTFSELVAALAARGVSRAHRAPEVVARRVEHALATRPRLALEHRHAHEVAEWARAAESDVAARIDALVTELRTGLSARSGWY